MARKNRNKNNNVVKVDFTDTESNVLLPETSGATLKVVSASSKDNDGDGSIVIKYEIIKADSKKIIGKTGLNYFNLGSTSLWVLRNFLEAVGVEVPAGPLDIDLTELVDLEFVADITQNSYNDRTSNRLANFAMTGDDNKKDEDEDEIVVRSKKRSKDEDDEDEDEAPKSKKNSKSSDDDEDEDEAPKSKKKSRKDEDDEDEEPKSRKKSKRDEEDEDEDEAPKSKKKSRKLDDEDDEDEPKSKKKKKSLITEDEVRDMDEKELKSLIREHDLDVDLSEYSNIRKKSMAVIHALSEADLLDAD